MMCWTSKVIASQRLLLPDVTRAVLQMPEKVAKMQDNDAVAVNDGIAMLPVDRKVGSHFLDAAPLKIVLPLKLEGSVVRLEPIRREHAELFWDVAKNDLDDIFRWIPYSMKSRKIFAAASTRAFDEQDRGESVVFATVERSSGRTIGSTRFMNIDRINRRVEIGSTWIAPAWQRTAVNTEAKYLMLRHAFEVWQCIRVELKTDA